MKALLRLAGKFTGHLVARHLLHTGNPFAENLPHPDA